MTAKAIHKKLTEQRKDLDALRSDLPKIEGLLEQHREAADEANRAGAPFDEQATLRSRVDGFESVLRQHNADITALESEIARLQAEYDTQSTKDKHTAAWSAHETLLSNYRKEARELLCDVLSRLEDLRGLNDR